MTSTIPDSFRLAGNERGDRARALLLDAAEELFAERGVDAVPVRAIAAAAGQRNNAAVYYHFGDKDGLVHALLADRMERIEAARRRLIDEAGDLSQLDVAALLTMLWQPVLDLGRAKSAHWFTRFRLTQGASGKAVGRSDASYPEGFPASLRIHDALHALHPELSPAHFRYRMNLVAMLFWSAVSWHNDAARAANQTWSTRFSLDEVVRVSTMALKAPTK